MHHVGLGVELACSGPRTEASLETLLPIWRPQWVYGARLNLLRGAPEWKRDGIPAGSDSPAVRIDSRTLAQRFPICALGGGAGDLRSSEDYQRGSRIRYRFSIMCYLLNMAHTHKKKGSFNVP